MARSVKKGIYVEDVLIKKVRKAIEGGEKEITKPIKTWSRSSTIIPIFVGFTFLVHNGKAHVSVKVNEHMIGHKLGEFVPTKISARHSEQLRNKYKTKK